MDIFQLISIRFSQLYRHAFYGAVISLLHVLHFFTLAGIYLAAYLLIDLILFNLFP